MRAHAFAQAAASVAALIGAALLAGKAQAADCPVTQDQLAQALRASVVTRDGTVCAVAFSGNKADDQWPGSRAVAMQKANTANAFSVAKMAISTANLFAGAQPGQPLYGLITASPPSPETAAGDAAQFGTASDPMVGKRIGGVIVFGGGLALYNDSGVVGGLGISGDSSCADHNVAWRVRQALKLDRVPAGVNPNRRDAIIYDLGADGKSASGFGHVKCNGTEADIGNELEAAVGGATMK